MSLQKDRAFEDKAKLRPNKDMHSIFFLQKKGYTSYQHYDTKIINNLIYFSFYKNWVY